MIRVGITHGDINGISYEILLNAFSDVRMAEICIPIIYGSQKMAAFHRKALEMQHVVNFNQISDTKTAVANKVNIINCVDDNTRIELGQITQEAGNAALAALERATDHLKRRYIDVLVALPVNNENIRLNDTPFGSHRQYFEEKFARSEEKSLTVFVSGQQRIALAVEDNLTSESAQDLSKEEFINRVRVFNRSLKRDFRVERPRIAILSPGKELSNPDMILPTIKELQNQKVLCFGPFEANEFFESDNPEKFDGILTLYNDKATVPFNILQADQTVNFTAGLMTVCTSPIEDPGYAIAGKNQASDESLRQAIYTAIDIFKNRQFYDESHANPLQKLYEVRGSDNEELDLRGEENNNK